MWQQNERQRYVPLVGLYPIPVPIYETRSIDFGKKEKVFKDMEYTWIWSKAIILFRSLDVTALAGLNFHSIFCYSFSVE